MHSNYIEKTIEKFMGNNEIDTIWLIFNEFDTNSNYIVKRLKRQRTQIINISMFPLSIGSNCWKHHFLFSLWVGLIEYWAVIIPNWSTWKCWNDASSMVSWKIGSLCEESKSGYRRIDNKIPMDYPIKDLYWGGIGCRNTGEPIICFN